MSECSRCGETHERIGQRHCAPCHAAYMREWRKTHPLSPAAFARAEARHIAFQQKKRGHIAPEACIHCGASDAEMHHIDHEKPLEVVWLCRKHHLEWHAFSRKVIVETFAAWVHGNVSCETFVLTIPDREAIALASAVADLSDELARSAA